MKLSPTETKLAELQERLTSWNSFVNEIQVPSELAPAFMTRRVDLVRLAVPRALTPEECFALYQVIGGLLETNEALRDHARMVSELAQQLTGGLAGTLHAARRMRMFSDFRDPLEPGSEDEL